MTHHKYRLSDDIKPIKYHIIINPVASGYNSFNGLCGITYEYSGPLSNSIILNACELDIKTVELIDDHQSYHYINAEFNKTVEQVKLNFASVPSFGMLVIKYTGKITEELTGFYKAMQDDHLTMFTQFEPSSARRCFPCFDEPCFKAKFKLEILSPVKQLVLSNTELAHRYEYNNYTLYSFKETPIMSTYLLAFYLGKADYIEKATKDNIIVRVYSSKPIEYSEYALDVAIRCVEYLTEFFGVEYPLNKLDLIAVAQLSAAAMENWGLITFQEDVLLCDPINCLTDQIDIAYTICHEIAHQWFGNLVTMDWWSALWLNESFATWTSWLVVEHLFPEWNAWEQFYSEEIISAMNADSLQNSHPIQVSVENPSDINEIFDAISYSKGSAIINMLVDYLGMDTLKRGLRYYFQKFHYQNATTLDLWHCLEHVSNKPIITIMDAWINKQNYPLLNVSIINNNIFIEQEVFSYDKHRKRQVSDPVWLIPLENNLFIDKIENTFSQDTLNVADINKNSVGFYRINYELSILTDIIENKFDQLSVLDITEILSNSFEMLKSNRLTLKDYFSCLEIILNKLPKSKPSHILLEICRNSYNYFIMIIKDGPAVEQFKSILYKRVSGLAKEIGFKFITNDNMDTIISRTVMLDLLCQFDMQPAVNYCLELFDAFLSAHQKNQPMDNIINPNIIATVFETALIQENKSEQKKAFDLLVTLLHTNKLYDEKIIGVIGLTSDKDQYMTVLNLIFDNVIGMQYKTSLISSAGHNHDLNQYLLPFIKENWNAIFELLKNNMFGLNRIVCSLKYLTDDGTLITDLQSFFHGKEKVNMDMELRKTIEHIQINTNFKKNILLL